MLESIGAVAGWLAGAGLVVLSALSFSQARDVRRLREWAGHAPEHSARRPQPSSRRIGTVTLVGLLVLAVAGACGISRLAGGGSGNARTSTTGTPKRKGAAVKPGAVTVAVLNGTMIPGLAAMLSGQIAAAGFKQGTIDDYSDKRLAESVIQFMPGHQAEAKAVSRTIGIGRREPVTADGRALAPGATVIVIAGADKAP